MKKLIVAGLLLASTSAIAGTPLLDVAAFNGNWDDVREALIVEVKNSKFDCKWNTSGPSNIAIVNQLVSLLDDSETVITLSDNHAQPLILAVTPISESLEVTAEYTTSTNFKHLVRVDVRKESIRKVRKNTGTLLEPKFEIVTIRTPQISGSCQVSQ